MKNNLDVRTVALQRAIQLLDSLGAQYKIITADGGEFGRLVAAPEPKKRNLTYKFGDLVAHYKPVIDGMAIGDVRDVPVGEFDLDTLQRSVGAWTCKNWGPKSVFSLQRHDKNAVEVMRVA